MRTRRRRKIQLGQTDLVKSQGPEQPSQSMTPIDRDLAVNLKELKAVFNHCSDVVFREFRTIDGRDAVLIYIEGLSEAKQIDAYVLDPITKPRLGVDYVPRVTFESMQRDYLNIADVSPIHTVHEVVNAVFVETKVVLIIDEEPGALVLGIGGGAERGVEEPSTEAVIRGPREGFNENLRVGTSLIRRRIRTPDLKIESHELGKYTKTKVAICYIAGIAREDVVQEVRERVSRIETDGIIDSAYIEEFIEDNPFSPFPQIQNTERPDVVAAALLEGRIAVLANGSPFALIMPVNLWGALQSAEDYYERFEISNAIRWLRYIFMFIALFLPSLYVAITTFHQEMLPTKLLFTIAAAREATPFPAVLEALLMEITFEALREAGIRLPKTIGSTISIVGALVIGQASVQAGIVSAPMVIVVAITGIASFVIPRYNFAIALRLLRFPMILLAGTLGLFGIVVGLLAIIIHLSGLRSFGVPYLSPVSPYRGSGMKDVFVRTPHWNMTMRPWQTSKPNLRRQTDSTTPANRIPGYKAKRRRTGGGSQ